MIPLPDGGGEDPLMGLRDPLPYMEPWQIAVLGTLIGLLALWVFAHVILERWRHRRRVGDRPLETPPNPAKRTPRERSEP